MGRERLAIPARAADAMVAHARAALPNEACGLLAGDAASGRVTTFHAARNEHVSPLRYSVHPDDLVRIVLGIEDAGEDLVGIFHSHVASPAVPSASDIREARYPDAVHVLASLAYSSRDADDAAVLRAWRIGLGEPSEVELVVAEGQQPVAVDSTISRPTASSVTSRAHEPSSPPER